MLTRDTKTQLGQNAHLLFLRDLHADQGNHPRRIQHIGPVHIRHVARLHHIRRLTAAQIQDHLRGLFDGWRIIFRVNPALVAIARVRVDLQRPTRCRNLDRVPNSGLQKHIGRGLSAAGFQTAHDARNAFNTLVVRNHDLSFRKGVFLFIQTDQRLSALSAMHM